MPLAYCKPDLAPFPPLSEASEDGLLAVGGDLSPARLQCAYSLGIFPWFEQGQPILWWSPDPRCVLIPAAFKTSRSLSKTIKSTNFSIRFDSAFEQVIEACAMPRGNKKNNNNGTWITDDMRDAYTNLHHLGCAHSVEVWQNDNLVGGLYGVALGRIFYGESMFSRVNDASKFALKCLCERLQHEGFMLIDCQVESAHLLSLGAKTMPRAHFIHQMEQALAYNVPFEKWS